MPDSDLKAVERSLPGLETAMKEAISDRDHDAIAAAERAWIAWRTRVERFHTDGLPPVWQSVFAAVRQMVADALADMAPITAMRTLDEIAVDVLFVLREGPEQELATAEVLERVLFGNKDDVDYLGYLDRLSAGGLVTPRWQLDKQYWRLSVLGRQTMTAIDEEVQREYERFLAGTRPGEGVGLIEAAKRNHRSLDHAAHARIPAWAGAVVTWDGGEPSAEDAWFETDIPADKVFLVRYEKCLMISHIVGRCKQPARGGTTVAVQREEAVWSTLYKDVERYKQQERIEPSDERLKERDVSLVLARAAPSIV